MERRSGRSTRIVDKLVQDFFSDGKAIGFDHYDGEPVMKLAKDNIRRVVNRLAAEHGMEYGRDFTLSEDSRTLYNVNFKTQIYPGVGGTSFKMIL